LDVGGDAARVLAGMASVPFLLGTRREKMARPALTKTCSKAKRRAARIAATLSIAGF
jgi:hypothetical protein